MPITTTSYTGVSTGLVAIAFDSIGEVFNKKNLLPAPLFTPSLLPTRTLVFLNEVKLDPCGTLKKNLTCPFIKIHTLYQPTNLGNQKDNIYTDRSTAKYVAYCKLLYIAQLYINSIRKWLPM